MTQFEVCFMLLGFSFGVIITIIGMYLPLKRVRKQLYKVRGQVYYWSRQIPVTAKRGRPRKSSSVK
jgi:hypothetical protein